MRHLELHIIQSVPVSCLNRDELGSPKTAVFGGAQRGRVSSQSWKREIRNIAKELAPENFKGERTRLMFEPLQAALLKAGVEAKEAGETAKKIVDELVTLDAKAKDRVKSKTMFLLSPLELETIARAYAEKRDIKKAIKAGGGAATSDAADISLFGRMVASDHSLTVEAAASFSHAISTHRVDNELDFFSAVDDLQPNDEAGAGMTGNLEFNSATYYRFAALNLDLLADQDHLGALDQKGRQEIVRAFIEATIKAMPSARQNTMNANTLPSYVLGVVREKGHPIQLVNAFENPVRPGQGVTDRSIELLKAENQRLKETWGIESVFEQAIPDIGFKSFLDGMVANVR